MPPRLRSAQDKKITTCNSGRYFLLPFESKNFIKFIKNFALFKYSYYICIITKKQPERMTSLTEFFNKHEDEALKGISHKNSIIKRNIIAHMAVNGECTLSELTKELHISVPTITKLVQELVEENIVTDLGKVETPGGRRPNIFGLANSAIYFAGVNVGRDNMRFLITDLQNNIIKEENDFTFELIDRPQCIERICSNIEHFIANCGIDRGKILGLGVCMTG